MTGESLNSIASSGRIDKISAVMTQGYTSKKLGPKEKPTARLSSNLQHTSTANFNRSSNIGPACCRASAPSKDVFRRAEHRCYSNRQVTHIDKDFVDI